MTDLGVDDVMRVRRQGSVSEPSSNTATSEAMSRREGSVLR
jgi:hypothetical protein